MVMEKAEVVLAAAAAYVVAMVISFLKKAFKSSYGAYYTGGDHHREGGNSNLLTFQTHVQGVPLPPGSMGLPCVGESLSFKSQRHQFWISRQQQYVFHFVFSVLFLAFLDLKALALGIFISLVLFIFDFFFISS